MKGSVAILQGAGRRSKTKVRDVWALNKVLHLDLQDERQKLAQQLSSLEKHGIGEKQLKRHYEFVRAC